MLLHFEPYRLVAQVRRPMADRDDIVIPIRTLAKASSEQESSIEFPIHEGNGALPWFKTYTRNVRGKPYQYFAVECVVRKGFPLEQASAALATMLRDDGFESV